MPCTGHPKFVDIYLHMYGISPDRCSRLFLPKAVRTPRIVSAISGHVTYRSDLKSRRHRSNFISASRFVRRIQSSQALSLKALIRKTSNVPSNGEYRRGSPKRHLRVSHLIHSIIVKHSNSAKPLSKPNQTKLNQLTNQPTRSISIACWVVVFSPQIIENFRRGSADGLSLLFLIIWLAGDVFNILGAVLQGVLPTMTILAVYYTLADIVLLVQCFYYRGFSFREEGVCRSAGQSTGSGMNGVEDEDEDDTDDETASADTAVPVNKNRRNVTERTALLGAGGQNGYSGTGTGFGSGAGSASYAPHAHAHTHTHNHNHAQHTDNRRLSTTSFIHSSIDGTHLSPATPFVNDPPSPGTPQTHPIKPNRVSTLHSLLFNTTAILLVCAAGVLGWYFSVSTDHHHNDNNDGSGNGNGNPTTTPLPTFDPLGQVFGYLCAVLYLGSRLPQILLNFRRKSTEGVSLLFFLFACLGNLSYVLSILAFVPVCSGDDGGCRPGEARGLYGRYILVNLSWLVGSLGTLVLDLVIFGQFFLYQSRGVGLEGGA